MGRRIAIVLALALFVPAMLASPAPAQAQLPEAYTFRTGLIVSDLVFDEGRNVIYASVASSDTNHPNKVATIDVVTGAVVGSVALGTVPRELAISADGSALFVGIDGQGAVKKFSLPSMTPQWSYTFGEYISGYTMTAGDIAVMPGANDTIAVSRRAIGLSPSATGVVIIDGGVARTVTTPAHIGADVIAFGDDPSELYGSDTSSSAAEFIWHTVDASGVVESHISGHGGGEIVFHENLVYSSTGKILNAAIHPPTLADTLGQGTSVTIDEAQNAVYFTVSTFDSGQGQYRWSIVGYDLDSRERIGEWRLPSGTYTSLRDLISIGPGLLAYVDAGELVLADLNGLGSLGEYTALNPARILDTRDGLGRGGVIAPVGPGQTIDVPIAGRGGVPASGASAVVMNVTVTNSTAAGYLTVFPTGIERPFISTHNFTAGQTIANLVTMPIGADGNVSVYNPFGSVDVIFDVAGFYATSEGPDGSRFFPLTPQRIYDSREPTRNPLGANQDRTIDAFPFGLPAPQAVVLNVTITEPTAPSHLSVYPSGMATPTVSNLNFVPGQTIANQVIVRVGPNNRIDLYNYGGSTHVVIDIVGYFSDSEIGDQGRFVAVDPYRAFDSRESSPFAAPGKLGLGDILILGGPTTSYLASVQNVTVTDTVGAGYVTAYPYSDSQWQPPFASTLNYVTGTTVPNHAIVPLGPQIGYYNHGGQTHLVVDIFGAFMKE